jgi:carbamoyltransferase
LTVHVLGISAFYHDSAAAIVRDGEVVAAAQEERFSRKKHDPRFPRAAINYCLEEAFIEPDELDAVVFYDNPILTLDRVISSQLSTAPRSEDQWVHAAQSTLGVKLFAADYVRDYLKTDAKVLFTNHHLSHAASAFYPSPFDRAAVLTMDGVGEWATTSISDAQGTRITPLEEIHYPDSLGLLYSAFTYFCGFKVNSGEYKLMGLAPYGTPRYADRIREHLITIFADGSYRLNTNYLGYLESDRMTNHRFDTLFDGPPREPESRITRREMDIAASIQEVTEEVVLGLARRAASVTGAKDLCLAGGVALNCVANGRLQREQIFDHVWIQPAAGDAGGALGAALLGAHRYFDVPRKPVGVRDSQKGSYLGPSYSEPEAEEVLRRFKAPFTAIRNREERAKLVAGAIAEGKIVGLFSGRMEFGPRALGARSILGDPRDPETQVTMNLKIKYRESFRPFAPSVLADRAAEYFDLDAGVESPYMLLVADVQDSHRRESTFDGFDDDEADMLRVVREARSDIPAVTHVDYSARLQTVAPDEHPDYHAILRAFDELTGCPVLVNTSFNVRGEPIVCTPEDAYRCFMRTEIDMLVIDHLVLNKTEQPSLTDDESWRDEYELD